MCVCQLQLHSTASAEWNGPQWYRQKLFPERKALLDYPHLTCVPSFRENEEKDVKFKLKDLKS